MSGSAEARPQLAFKARALGSAPEGEGLTAIAVHNPGVPTASVAVSLHVGQLDEGEGEFGHSYLVGTLLEEGTRARDAVALAEAVESIGGSLSTNESGGRVMCPATELRAACGLVREVVLEPGFRAADVDRVKLEVLSEIEADAEEPTTVAAHRFRQEVYGVHPFARPNYGGSAMVQAFDAAAARRYHEKWFRPQRGYVVIAGPMPCEESLDLLAETFGEFAGVAAGAAEHLTPPPPAMPEAARDVHLEMDREQVHVYLGHPGIRRADPDYHALLVMDNVLGSGSGFTARIPKKLRDEMGLCYSVGASITSSAGLEPGTFRAYIGTSPEHRTKAIDGFLAEIRAIQATPPTADEVETALDYLTGSFVLGLERNANLAGFAVRSQRHGLGFDYIERFPDLIRAVTPEDVTRVASAYIHPDRVVVVSAGASKADVPAEA